MKPRPCKQCLSIRLTGLNAQSIVAIFVQEYMSLITFNQILLKQTSLDHTMLAFVYRSVKYTKGVDVKFHCPLTFFFHLAHAFYLRAYYSFTLSFSTLLDVKVLIFLSFQNLTAISQLLLICA